MASAQKRISGVFVRIAPVVVAMLWLVVFLPNGLAGQSSADDATSLFPNVAEVIGSRTFDTLTDEYIYFMQAIHDRYHDHWANLLEANITLNDYTLAPEKMQRFVDELGEAMRDRNDPDAISYLAPVINDPSFYAGSNVYHAEILQSAAKALIKIGPDGRKALAGAFTEVHYRTDSGSLEDLADVVGTEKPAGPEFVNALSATAFDFSTANGAYYSRCTTTAVKSLLNLPSGPVAVQEHLKTDEIFDNPGRFEAVMDGIAGAQCSELKTNLMTIEVDVLARLATLTNTPGGYRDDLQELEMRIHKLAAWTEK